MDINDNEVGLGGSKKMEAPWPRLLKLGHDLSRKTRLYIYLDYIIMLNLVFLGESGGVLTTCVGA